MSVKVKKHVRELVRWMRELGCREVGLETAGHNHHFLWFTAPDGRRLRLSVATSPRQDHWDRAARGRVRRLMAGEPS